jgi:hypothetical protein
VPGFPRNLFSVLFQSRLSNNIINELKRVGEEMFVPLFGFYHGTWLEKFRNTAKNKSQISSCPCLDSNHVSSKYEPGALSLYQTV